MRTFRKGLSLVLLVIMAMSIMTFGAFANMDLEGAKEYTKNNITEDWAQNMLTTDQAQADPSSTFTIVTDDGTTYFLKSGKTEDEFVRSVNLNYKNANVTDTTVQIQDQLGLEPDLGGASDTLKGFVPIINILLGIIVVAVTMGLGVITAFDICYIVFPVFRNKCEDAKVSGQGFMAGGKTANGGTKLRFVSDEAQYAVQHCTIESGKNPLTAYLGKRILAYVFVAIVIFILLTGNITIITNIALKVVSYIMDTLAKLA